MNVIRLKLASSIRKRRKLLKISTHTLAKLIGVGQPRIIEIEKAQIKGIDYYLACIQALDGQINIKWSKKVNRG